MYGELRITKDIDITLGVDIDSLQTVLKAADAAGLSSRAIDVEEFVKRTNVVPMRDTPSGIQVDLILSFVPYEQQAIKGSRPFEVAGRTVMFASPEDVIIHKLVAGRPRDIEDIKGILNTIPELDRNYLQRWLPTFREAVHERNLQAEFDAIERSIRN